MIKKFIVMLFGILFLGCNSLSIPTSIDSSENSERTLVALDSENEVIGTGSSKIAGSGTLVANGKASRDAKDKLKARILIEEDIIFKSFLVPADPYTKKILAPALPDLMDYTANQLIQKAVEKDSWIENNKAYIVYSISKSEILAESQNIFIQYLDDITNKFQLIKEGVNVSQ
ncbi:MAG: hypothetical protein ACRCZR_03295 [Cetobacterium sp.]|uniref:hypothetical protein n=1 Tax=Cetobacterium sp. TaxID=2071632 RepID=UPI003F2F7052